ncbi:MAG TPA: RND family transporter [Gammaproteobacteria bacterium]|nr:RND family transporter [Gammaproteobacteria bacterium]
MNIIATNLVRYRWLLMLLSLVLIGTLTSGVRFVGFATDYEVWFSDDNPQLKDFSILQNTYDKSDNVLFLITPKEGDVFTQQTLASIEWLTKQAWQMPYSTRVDSLTNFQHTYAIEDDLVVADLVVHAKRLSNSDLTKIKQTALKEPLLLHRIISEDAAVTAVSVTINLPKNSPEGSPTVTAYARDLVTQLKLRNPNLQMHLTGLVVMDNAFMEASQKDMGSLTLIMFGLIIFGLLIFLRSITGTVSILIVMLLSIMATVGFSGWIGVLLTPVSAGAPTIVMTIVVANAVHILVTMIHGMRAGLEKREALIESLRINMQPVVLATVTTVIGFLSMHFSDVPPFHDLGNMVAVGVITTLLLSMTFLPWLLMLLPMRVHVIADHSNRHMQGFSNFIIAKHKTLLWSFTAITVVLVSFIPNNVVNDNIWEYFETSVPFRVDTDYASDHLTGPYYLEYHLKSDEIGGISNPVYLKTVDNFQHWLNQQPEVVHVNTITDIMKRLNKNLHADDESWYRLPEDKNLAAQYLLLYEMSLPYGLDLTNQINLDKSATRVVASLHNLSNNSMIAFNKRAVTWLDKNAPNYELIASSPMYMFSHISLRTVEQMIGGVAFALVMISILIIVALRSFKIGLISLIPNLVPPVIAFGVWGILIGEVGFALAVGLGMTIGIIVDDTVHFLSKYLRARREKGLNAEEAVRYAFSNVGTALIITTIVLVVGFSVLILSSFKINTDLGMITALTIGIALIVDFVLLPSLLIQFDTHEYSTSLSSDNLIEHDNQAAKQIVASEEI